MLCSYSDVSAHLDLHPTLKIVSEEVRRYCVDHIHLKQEIDQHSIGKIRKELGKRRILRICTWKGRKVTLFS
jgi:hypothetical protein